MKNLHKKISLLLVAFVALLISAMFASAEISNTTGIDRGDSERYSVTSTPGAEQAEAGNVTGFSINATSITQRWQGFYGNITGQVVLGDGSNNLFYEWGNANPTGEVFASNHTGPAWTGLSCVNWSTSPSDARYGEQELNEYIGYTTGSDRAKQDSVNGTFNQTFGDDSATLTVGSLTFTNSNNCSMATPFTNSLYNTANYQEVILTDNESIIFAGILELSAAGFDGSTADFQLLVGVNGTTQGTTRDYYFFVELN